MKKINTIIWILFFSIIYTNVWGSCFIGFDVDYNKIAEKTYTKNTCRAGYKALKKELKSEAKQICKDVHGSPSWDIFRCKHFTKISCEKNKQKRHKTKVTVKAQLSVYCR